MGVTDDLAKHWRAFSESRAKVLAADGNPPVEHLIAESEARCALEDMLFETDGIATLIELAQFVNAMRERMSGHYVTAQDIYALDGLLETLGRFNPEPNLADQPQ